MEKQEKNHAVSHVSSYVLIDRWMVTWERGWGDASGWTQPSDVGDSPGNWTIPTAKTRTCTHHRTELWRSTWKASAIPLAVTREIHHPSHWGTYNYSDVAIQTWLSQMSLLYQLWHFLWCEWGRIHSRPTEEAYCSCLRRLIQRPRLHRREGCPCLRHGHAGGTFLATVAWKDVPSGQWGDNKHIV
jgi:hypothetical protein